jgi:hypothetical protein
MRTLAITCLLSLIATPLPADDAPKDDHAQIEYWIAKLGDDNPKVRQQASESLRKIGQRALPALTDAARSKDAEVRNRAATLSQQIEQDAAEPDGIDVLPPAPDDRMPRRRRPLIPRDFGPLIMPRPADAFQRFNRAFSFAEQGRTVNITENNDGITVTTTETRDGKTVTKVSTAKNKEALKKHHPEAYELYEKHARLPPSGFDRLDVTKFERDQIARAFDQARRAMADHRKLLDRQRDMMLEHRKLVEELRRQAMEEVERLRREE